jgi:hypothetical protein
MSAPFTTSFMALTIGPSQVSCPHRMPVIPRARAASACAIPLPDAIEGGEIGVIELERGRRHVLLEVAERARARNQQHPVVAR